MDIKLQGYDQVIALSQRSINSSLKYYFTGRDQEKLVKFTKPSDNTKWYAKSSIEVPTVELIDQKDADSAHYYIKFKKGTREFYVYENSTDWKDYDISDWKIAIRVDFTVKETEHVPEEIVRALAAT